MRPYWCMPAASGYHGAGVAGCAGRRPAFRLPTGRCRPRGVTLDCRLPWTGRGRVEHVATVGDGLVTGVAAARARTLGNVRRRHQFRVRRGGGGSGRVVRLRPGATGPNRQRRHGPFPRQRHPRRTTVAGHRRRNLIDAGRAATRTGGRLLALHRNRRVKRGDPRDAGRFPPAHPGVVRLRPDAAGSDHGRRHGPFPRERHPRRTTVAGHRGRNLVGAGRAAAQPGGRPLALHRNRSGKRRDPRDARWFAPAHAFREGPGRPEPWRRSGTGATIIDLPTRITRIRIEGEYTGQFENFMVECGAPGDWGGTLVNVILGTSSIASSTTYSGIHSARRYYGGRGQPCRELQVHSSGVRWTITETSPRSGFTSPSTGSVRGDEVAVRRAREQVTRER